MLFYVIRNEKVTEYMMTILFLELFFFGCKLIKSSLDRYCRSSYSTAVLLQYIGILKVN